MDEVNAGRFDEPGLGDVVDLELDVGRDPARLDWRFAGMLVE
jgi:hypothetical protein